MFCSTIIPTVNRSTLARSVKSVLEQNFDREDFEVIVVNDSGKPLSKADWQKSNRVRVIHTSQRKLSVARNTGAAIAKGRYLHFLDDDDWLLPNALENFWTLAKDHRNSVWLYGGAKLVDEAEKCFGELNLNMSGNCFAQIVAGSWIPVQASLINAEAFFTVGGFHPLFDIAEETELCRRMSLRGDLAHTPEVVACILRGITWRSTMNYDRAPELNRWSRDSALSEPGAFSRLRKSAKSGYWSGRIFQAYLTATLWNYRHNRLFTAASRALYCLASLVLSGRHILSPDFWRAVKDTQVPCTQQRILEHS